MPQTIIYENIHVVGSKAGLTRQAGISFKACEGLTADNQYQ